MIRLILYLLTVMLTLCLVLMPVTAQAQEVHISVSFGAVIVVGSLTVIIAFGFSQTASKKDDKTIKLAEAGSCQNEPLCRGMIPILRW
jgi:uncharacterized membrane protein